MDPISRAPLVVSTETAGLGNRIKSWVSAMRLGERAYVRWAVTKNMPATFDDLFVNDCAVPAVPAGATEYGSWRLAVLAEDEPFLPAGFATVGAGAHPLIRGLGKALVERHGQAHGPLPLHGVPEAALAALRASATRATSISSTAESRSTFETSTCRCFAASRCSPRSRLAPRSGARGSTRIRSACRSALGATTLAATASTTCRPCAGSRGCSTRRRREAASWS